ncbi:MAG: FHA domain-containing protein [Roseburia sp.]|nr:FHA domain-containing protein [Roseburia sp.]
MKIEYVRNMMASHMVIEQKKELEEWESEMISNCQSKGILFAKNQREDEREMLWYDITGRQALEVILESREMDYAMLCHFLMQLYEVAETLEAHLLLSDALLLRPECIFADYGMNQIYFCYYPGNEENLSQAFGNLMEYLLTRLDHQDERAVETAYGIYEKVVTEGAGLLKLGEWLRAPYGKERGANEEEQGSLEIEHIDKTSEISGKRELETPGKRELETPEKKELEMPGKRGLEMPGKREQEVWEEESEGVSEQRKNGVFQKIAKKLGDMIESLRSGGRKKRENEQDEPFVFEPEEETEIKTSRPTVLLTQISKQPEGILRYEGSSGCSDLEIKNTPYVIGSEETCDGYIPSGTVSRRHARITRVEDIYFIEDLNSSNGTYVGGELLNYKVKMSLQKNEIILFADEKFRFI